MLSSVKLTLVLIVLLMLFCFAGSVLPQEGLTTPADMSRWRARHFVVSEWLGPIGLFHAFRSWPFLATIIALSLNTMTCTALHFVRKGGFRALVGPDAFTRTGFLLLHVSLLLLFAGGFLSAAASFEGTIILTEGQPFKEERESYADVRVGPLQYRPHTGNVVRLRSVDIQYQRERYPVAVSSRLDIENEGTNPAEAIVSVNNPATIHGLSFTQSETGFSPHVVIHGTRTRPLFNSFVALKTFRSEGKREYRDFLPLPGGHQRVLLALYPSFKEEQGSVVKTGDRPDNPLLVLQLQNDEGKIVETRQVKLGGNAKLGQHEVTFVELRRWSSFRVGHDPGYGLVCIALWMGLGAMIMRYAREIRLWFGEWTSPARKDMMIVSPRDSLPRALDGGTMIHEMS
ncbi:MAG: cytochrome c biogenesis protein ResB [Planctomycetota bacterium]